MTVPARRHWIVIVPVLIAAGLIVAAIAALGPPGSASRTQTQLITAAAGVVQSTVSGSGNVEPAVDDAVNFRTSGTLQTIDVHVGQHVRQGQLLGTLNPTSAQLALDQAGQSLTAAEDQLSAAEQASYERSLATATAASREFVSYTPADTTATSPTTSTTPAAPVSRPTVTTPVAPPRTITRTVTVTTPTPTRAGTGSATSGSAASATTGAAATAATIASARAAVDQAQANLHSAEQTLADTKLYAPAAGVVVSLAAVSPGDSIAAGTSGGASASGSGGSGSGSGSGGSGSGGSGSGGSGSGGSGSGGSGSGSSGSLGSSSSASSTPFAEIVDSSRLTMTVAFSESDIAKVRVGQPATVTLDALSGVELGARVSAISQLGAISSGVVSYDATLTLDQSDGRVRAGMSASAAVITGQAQGVTLPNSAITGSGSLATVSLVQGGHASQHQVAVGLRGDSRTQIVSGLRAGDEVMVTTTLPPLGTGTAGSSSSSSGTLGGRLGGGGFGGGGFGGGGLAGGGRFFRGGG